MYFKSANPVEASRPYSSASYPVTSHSFVDSMTSFERDRAHVSNNLHSSTAYWYLIRIGLGCLHNWSVKLSQLHQVVEAPKPSETARVFKSKRVLTIERKLGQGTPISSENASYVAEFNVVYWAEKVFPM